MSEPDSSLMSVREALLSDEDRKMLQEATDRAKKRLGLTDPSTIQRPVQFQASERI